MAVQNRLNQNLPAQKKPKEITYDANGKQVNLSVETVKNYLVSGNKERVTNEEVVMFINLCKFSGLNPWLKEAYCIKYGNEPATMVVGKEAFLKRAESHPALDGCESGVIVMDMDGNIEYRKGSFKLPEESIIGGWAEVWRKDKSHSTRIEVSFDEYAGRKSDGSLNAQWSKKPGTMIRKVAQVQALREAFPNTFGGMYTAEEQGAIEPEFTVVADHVEDVEQPLEAPEIIPEPAEEIPSAADALFGN